jgi:hypothetical protein
MKRIALLALVSIALGSCDKYKDYKRGFIMDSGDITVNGCGYLLKLNGGGFVKPVYLNSAFQHDNMKVKVKLVLNGKKDTCDMGMAIYDEAIIEDIVRDND